MSLDNSLKRSRANLLTFLLSCTLCCIVVIAAASRLCADETDQPMPTADERRSAESNAELNEQAVHLLRSKCTSCHGAETAEGSLRLDSRESMLKGGDRGGVMISAVPRDSLLWQSIAGMGRFNSCHPSYEGNRVGLFKTRDSSSRHGSRCAKLPHTLAGP